MGKFFMCGFFLFVGIVIGFLLSPVKYGIGNNCGNTNNDNKVQSYGMEG